MKHRIVALTVLLDPIGQIPEAPILMSINRTAIIGNNTTKLIGKLLSLLSRDILASNKNSLIERHAPVPLNVNRKSGRGSDLAD